MRLYFIILSQSNCVPFFKCYVVFVLAIMFVFQSVCYVVIFWLCMLRSIMVFSLWGGGVQCFFSPDWSMISFNIVIVWCHYWKKRPSFTFFCSLTNKFKLYNTFYYDQSWCKDDHQITFTYYTIWCRIIEATYQVADVYFDE